MRSVAYASVRLSDMSVPGSLPVERRRSWNCLVVEFGDESRSTASDAKRLSGIQKTFKYIIKWGANQRDLPMKTLPSRESSRIFSNPPNHLPGSTMRQPRSPLYSNRRNT